MSDAPHQKLKRTERVVFFLSLGSSVYWWMAQVIDVYQIAVLGAIYEFLWLPFVAMIFGIPVVSSVFWAKEKFKVSSLYLYATLICVATLIGMIAIG